jgi:HEAT repeat protein
MGEQIPYYVATGDFKRVIMFGPAAMTALIAVLRSGSEERRMAVASFLGEIGDHTVVKPLTAALKDSEPTVRAAAASALARINDPALSASLLPLLKDRARNVRVAAIAAIGALGDLHALELLMDRARDREWEVRTALAEALGRLGDARALPTVLNLLSDLDHEVRQSAAAALGFLGDEAQIEALLMAMVDEHMGVRQAAARSLVMVEPHWERSAQVRALLPKLQQAVSAHDPGVQAAAAVLLRRLTGRNAAELLASEAKPLLPQADELVEMFRHLIGDPDECVRLAAAEALGRLKQPLGIQPLQNALLDPSKWVKQAAEQGLKIITSRTQY